MPFLTLLILQLQDSTFNQYDMNSNSIRCPRNWLIIDNVLKTVYMIVGSIQRIAYDDRKRRLSLYLSIAFPKFQLFFSFSN